MIVGNAALIAEVNVYSGPVNPTDILASEEFVEQFRGAASGKNEEKCAAGRDRCGGASFDEVRHASGNAVGRFKD